MDCALRVEADGTWRYDDRVRDRRFTVVAEELGIALASGFIDHEGMPSPWGP
jgi:hypothetical protein